MKNFENKKIMNHNPAGSRQSMGHDFIAGNNNQSVVEEKVAHLSLQLNQIIIKPYLQQALDYLKSSKFDAINAYNRLSDQIGNEVRIISQNIDEVTRKIQSCQETINRTQEIIRNKYSNATEEEISSGALNLEYEYNIVAEHYELSLQLSQEVSKYKSRIDNLLSTQGLLDESTVPSVNRIQLEVDNLELLIHNLDSTDYAEALAKKQGRKNTVDKKQQNKPALTGRQEALADYAEKLSENTVKNLNDLSKGPDVQSMDRYEDPNGLTINRKKYPFNDETFESDMGSKKVSKNNKRNQTPSRNYVENDEVLLTREELRMQKKLYKQQRKLNRMQMKNDYQQKIDAMKYEQAYLEGKNQEDINDVKKERRLSFLNKKNIDSENYKNEEQISGRFANVQQQEESIASAKAKLDKYSEYLTNEMQNQNAFDKEISGERSIKVIR